MNIDVNVHFQRNPDALRSVYTQRERERVLREHERDFWVVLSFKESTNPNADLGG